MRSFDSRNQSQDLLDEPVAVVSIICSTPCFAMGSLFSTVMTKGIVTKGIVTKGIVT